MITYAKDKGLYPHKNDCSVLLNQLITNATQGSTLQLEPGEYHLYEEHTSKITYYLSNTDITDSKNIAILILNKKNLTVDCNNSTFICHGRLQPFTIDGCENITVKNLRIDWDIPLSAEGICIEACDEYHDFYIDPILYPHYVENETLIFKGENWEEPLWHWGHTTFDPITGSVPVGTGDSFTPTKAQQLSNHIIRLYGKGLVPKDSITVLRHNPRCHAGIYTQKSTDIIYDNIYIHGTGGLGMLSQFNNNITFRSIHFKANDKRGRKIVCGHDDGIHLSNNRGQVIVENCYFYGLMDDAINIHGISVSIQKIIDKNTLICNFMQVQAMGFKEWAAPGHTISYLDHETMASIGLGEVESFTLNKINEFTIRFKNTIPDNLKEMDALENLSTTASLICRKNYFGPGRARGVLVSTPQQVLIEENVFETAGSAILLAGDANEWYESGACHDVLIRNNIFSSSCLSAMYQFCEAIISICPEIPKPDTNKPFHTNIRIEENVFNPFDYPVLYAFSVNQLSFQKNIIVRSNQNNPWHPRKHMITLNYCVNTIINNNQLRGEVLGQDVYLENTSQKDVTSDFTILP